MCLYKAKRIKVEKPMKVYKILVRFGGDYTTPFSLCKVSERVVNGDGCFHAEGVCVEEDEPFKVEEGYIHCYVGIKDVSREWFSYFLSIIRRRFFTEETDINFEVFECEVPIGTDCFEGCFEMMAGVVARKIRFVRRVGEDELMEHYIKG